MGKDRDREMSRMSVTLARAIKYAWCWYDRVQIAEVLARCIWEHEQMDREEQRDKVEQGEDIACTQLKC